MTVLQAIRKLEAVVLPKECQTMTRAAITQEGRSATKAYYHWLSNHCHLPQPTWDSLTHKPAKP